MLEGSTLPEEFLRDPSYWMNSQELEAWLATATNRYSKGGQENLLTLVGHSNPELRAWGVLDSVLRMLPHPQEILNQPERFLSYFISPGPPVDNIVRGISGIEFDVPVMSEQYPLVTSYLRAAFESLPVFVGQHLASCSWAGLHFKMNWSTEQESIFTDVDPGRQISPELMQSIVQSLEKHQQELEEKNRELQSKNESLVKAAKQIEKRIQNAPDLETFQQGKLKDVDFIDATGAEQIQQNLARLGDYMVRAQQLVTLLIAQDRMSPQVKVAMKKVDWPRVLDQFPVLVSQSRQILQNCQNLNDLQKHEGEKNV